MLRSYNSHFLDFVLVRMDRVDAQVRASRIPQHSQRSTFSKRVFSGLGVEEHEHGAHGDHVKAAGHLGEEQVARELDVESENVEEGKG